MTEEKRNQYNRIRIGMGFVILTAVMIALLFLNIGMGSTDVSFLDILRIISNKGMHDSNSVIIMQIRFPRAVAALFLGGGLALSGYLLQTFFHNPIAGPFVLGISSGAKMVVAFFMIFAVKYGISLHSFGLIGAAFLGSMLAMGFVLLLSKQVQKMSMLIIAGVMIGYICSAITDFIITFADDSNIVNLHNWSLGSFSGITWNNVVVILLVIGVTSIFVFFLSKPISAYQLGEAYARNLGVPIRGFRILLVISSSILSACVTAFAGPISFVGIAVPHLVKQLLKTSKPIVLIPASFLGGGIFCLFCDLLSRILFAPTEISVSSMTAVFGAPIVIFIMVKNKRKADF